MENVDIDIKGVDLDIELVQKVTRLLAERDNPDADLISWFDKKDERYSPWVPPECACDSEDHAYWERYGIHRGGRIKVVVNRGDYQLIYS